MDGPRGSGKTFVYTTLYYILKGRDKEVWTMSFTGVSAISLSNGRTVHNVFGLHVPIFSDFT